MNPDDFSVIGPGKPEPTDPELITRVRGGDVTAYGTLFSRHVEPARRLASMLGNGSDRDELVSEAFVKVLNVLLGGGGPDVAFRAYLLTSVRRLHIDRLRSDPRLATTDDLTPFEEGVPFTGGAVAGFEGGAAAKAFASLPERWQLVLWHLEVENQKPADIAPLLGMNPNSVSALAYRAREGLRQAFLHRHTGDLVSDACKGINGLLGGYVRRELSQRDSIEVREHLEQCRRCTVVYLELFQVNSALPAVLGPALLGSAAAAYLNAGGGAGAGAGLLVLLDRGKEAVLSHMAGRATTAAVIGAAAITALAVIQGGTTGGPAAAEQNPALSAGTAPTEDRLALPGPDGEGVNTSARIRSDIGEQTRGGAATDPLLAGREASASLIRHYAKSATSPLPAPGLAELRDESRPDNGASDPGSSPGRPAAAPTSSKPTKVTPATPKPTPPKPTPAKPAEPTPVKPAKPTPPKPPKPTPPKPAEPTPAKPAEPTPPKPAEPPRPAEPAKPEKRAKPSGQEKPSESDKSSGNNDHGRGDDRGDD